MAQFTLTGIVIQGNHLGRTLGYPTANLALGEDSSLALKKGVYAARVRIGGKEYLGMANIGYRPTIKENGFSVEVNIFDFSEDIYGKTITIDFVSRLRDEVKFESLDALVAQMKKDSRAALEALSGGFDTDPDAK